MKTATMQINCKVKFMYDENRCSEEEAAGYATDLFLCPNYHSKLEGVQLIDHEILDQEEL